MNFKVILISSYGAEIDKYLNIGCQFENVSIDRRGTSIINDSKLLDCYYRILKKITPDLVLTFTTKCSVYGGIACRILRIPYIVNNAGLMNAKGVLAHILTILYKIGFCKANCMMYQNDMEMKTIQLILNNKTYYRRIPGSGVDIECFKYSEYPKETDPIIFNFMARIMKSKGIEEYLKCADYIKTKYPKVIFRIYGDFDEEKYQKSVRDFCTKGIVEYYGQTNDIKLAISTSSAAIHPSYYEGMTNVVLEHSAMGRPCIGSNVPGVCDSIDDGKTGFVFEVGNSKSLINSVEKFINCSYRERKKMGIFAREKMVKEFDRSIVTKIYIEEIEEILGGI